MASFIILVILATLWNEYANQLPPAKLYRIGRDAKWYGLNLMGKDRNMTAFSDELLIKIAEQQRINIQIFGDNPTNLKSKLENNLLDGVLSPIKPDFNNKGILIFSNPYFLLGPVLTLPIHSNLQSSTQKIIGAHTEAVTALELEKNSSIQIQLYTDILQALADLNNNHIDAILFPALPTYIYTETFYPGRFRVATPPLTNEGLRLMSLETEEGNRLIHQFDEGLKTLKDNGTYQELLDKWSLVNTEQVE